MSERGICARVRLPRQMCVSLWALGRTENQAAFTGFTEGLRSANRTFSCLCLLAKAEGWRRSKPWDPG